MIQDNRIRFQKELVATYTGKKIGTRNEITMVRGVAVKALCYSM